MEMISREQLGFIHSIMFVPQHRTAEERRKGKLTKRRAWENRYLKFFSLFYIFRNTFCNEHSFARIIGYDL